MTRVTKAFLILLVLGGLWAPVSFAETCVTVSGGDWTVDANWDCGDDGVDVSTDGFPQSGDDAVIEHGISVASNVTVGSVEINDPGNLSGPDAVNGGVTVTLTVENSFSVDYGAGGFETEVSTYNSANAGSDYSVLNLDIGGSLTNDGDISLSNSKRSNVNPYTIRVDGFISNNGNINFGISNIDANAAVTNNGRIVMTGGSSNLGTPTLEVGGDFENDATNGSFETGDPSLVKFTGETLGQSPDQELAGDFFDSNAFEDLTVTSSGKVDPVNALNDQSDDRDPVQINGALTVNSGGVYGEGDADLKRVDEGSGIKYLGTQFSVSGDLFVSKVTFDASGTTTVAGAVFGEVRVTNGTTVDVADQNFSVAGLVGINTGGTLQVVGTQLELLGDLQVNGNLDADAGTVSFRGQGRSTCCSAPSFATDPNNRTSNEIQEVVGSQSITFGTLKIHDFVATAENPDGEDDADDDVETDVDFVLGGSNVTVTGAAQVNEASLTIARPLILQSDFEITNSGNFSVSSDEPRVEFTKGNPQNFITPAVTIPTLRIDKSSDAVTVKGPVTVSQKLDMRNGTLAPDENLQVWETLRLAGGTIDVTQNNGAVTLASGDVPDPDGNGQINVDAYIEYVDSDGDDTVDGGVTGDLTFERFLDGSVNWYYLASPAGTGDAATGSRDSFTDFLETGPNDLWTQGVTDADEAPESPAVSNVRLYDETAGGDSNPSTGIDNGWKPIDCSGCSATGLDSDMENGRGYIAYVYGPDNNDGTAVDVGGLPKTLTSDVEPRTTTKFDFDADGPGLTATDKDNDGIDESEGWNLLGNPYFATLDFCTMQSNASNISSTVEVWDPQNGGYVAYNCDANSGAGAGQLTNGYIAPHQAFFVKATSTSPSLSVDVTNAQINSTGFFQKSKPEETDNPPAAKLRLALEGFEYSTAVAFLDSSEVSLEDTDSYFFGGTGANGGLAFYSVLQDGTGISVNSLPRDLNEDTTIPLKVDGCYYGTPLSGVATFTWPMMRNLPPGWKFILEDTKTGEQVDLRSTSEYSVSYDGTCPATSDKSTGRAQSGSPPAMKPVSAGVVTHSVTKDGGLDTRFKLHVKPKESAASPTPPEGPTDPSVEFGSVNGEAQEQAAVLNWTTNFERASDGFYVQRQTSAGSFESIQGSFVDGVDSTTAETQRYSYRVQDLEVGTHTFRIKQVSTEGTATYTDPIDVTVRLSGSYKLSTYPNPVRAQATVEFAIKESADVTLALYNTLGQKVRTVYRGTPPAEETKRVPVETQNLSSGVYFLRLEGKGVTGTQRMTVVK
jgi:hypothetical protein